MARGGSSIIDINGIILLAAIGGAYVYRNEIIAWLNDFADTVGTGGGTGGGGGNGGGGGVPTGTTWYRANGPTAAMPWRRRSPGKCGASSGGDSGGNRWENESKGWGFKNGGGLEVVIYFKVKAGAMSTGGCKGGHIGLKHGGPNHSSPCDYSYQGSCCCWWDTGIDNDKQTSYIEIERPHPHNTNRKYFKKFGKIDSGKIIGVRWHISKEGAGFRLMMWTDTSGQTGANKWVEMYNVLDTGQFMPKDYYSHITNLQNIEIRISDAAAGDITILQAPVSRKINAGGATGTGYEIPISISSRASRLKRRRT